MFQNLAFAFNNDEINITLPEASYYLPMIEEIDPNDITRIRIIRDCKVHSFLIFLHFAIIYSNLTNMHHLNHCFYIKIYIAKWAIHIWKTTHKQYKDVLMQWFKGTGGGAGVPKEFETWDTTKYEIRY